MKKPVSLLLALMLCVLLLPAGAEVIPFPAGPVIGIASRRHRF